MEIILKAINDSRHIVPGDERTGELACLPHLHTSPRAIEREGDGRKLSKNDALAYAHRR